MSSGMGSRGFPAKGNREGAVCCSILNDSICALTEVKSEPSGVSVIAARTGFKSTYGIAAANPFSSSSAWLFNRFSQELRVQQSSRFASIKDDLVLNAPNRKENSKYSVP